MHEFRLIGEIASAMLRQWQQASEEGGPAEIESIHLHVGALELHSEAGFRRGFEVVVIGTPLEGVRLDIRIEPARIECPDCAFSGPLDQEVDGHQASPLAACPCCNLLQPVRGGRGVESIELRLREAPLVV